MPPKRGGFRGGHGGTFKKGFATKKRSSPDEDDSAPRTTKRAKDDDDEEEGTAVVPKLQTDDDGNQYIGVSHPFTLCYSKQNPEKRLTV